jgi:hypothetical protein
MKKGAYIVENHFPGGIGDPQMVFPQSLANLRRSAKCLRKM